MNLVPSGQDNNLEERRRQQARARRLSKRAELLAGEGRVNEAIDLQCEVTALRPHDAVAFLRLGLLYREANQIDPALSALRHSLTLSPDQRDPREALVATLLDAGRFAEIVGEAKALIKVAPRSIFARDVLCIAYMQLGAVEKALRTIGELIWLDPVNPDHYLKRAMLFQQQSNVKSAVGEYARVMDMAPERSEAYLCAEEALEALDDDQIRQIILLATEDRLFHWKLCRDAGDAAQERGFFLSPEGTARMRHIAQNHLPDLERDLVSSTTWGRVRFYN